MHNSGNFKVSLRFHETGSQISGVTTNVVTSPKLHSHSASHERSVSADHKRNSSITQQVNRLLNPHEVNHDLKKSDNLINLLLYSTFILKNPSLILHFIIEHKLKGKHQDFDSQAFVAKNFELVDTKSEEASPFLTMEEGVAGATAAENSTLNSIEKFPNPTKHNSKSNKFVINQNELADNKSLIKIYYWFLKNWSENPNLLENHKISTIKDCYREKISGGNATHSTAEATHNFSENERPLTSEEILSKFYSSEQRKIMSEVVDRFLKRGKSKSGSNTKTKFFNFGKKFKNTLDSNIGDLFGASVKKTLTGMSGTSNASHSVEPNTAGSEIEDSRDSTLLAPQQHRISGTRERPSTQPMPTSKEHGENPDSVDLDLNSAGIIHSISDNTIKNNNSVDVMSSSLPNASFDKKTNLSSSSMPEIGKNDCNLSVNSHVSSESSMGLGGIFL